jgi:hypothetical protein
VGVQRARVLFATQPAHAEINVQVQPLVLVPAVALWQQEPAQHIAQHLLLALLAWHFPILTLLCHLFFFWHPRLLLKKPYIYWHEL